MRSDLPLFPKRLASNQLHTESFIVLCAMAISVMADAINSRNVKNFLIIRWFGPGQRARVPVDYPLFPIHDNNVRLPGTSR